MRCPKKWLAQHLLNSACLTSLFSTCSNVWLKCARKLLQCAAAKLAGRSPAGQIWTKITCLTLAWTPWWTWTCCPCWWLWDLFLCCSHMWLILIKLAMHMSLLRLDLAHAAYCINKNQNKATKTWKTSSRLALATWRKCPLWYIGWKHHNSKEQKELPCRIGVILTPLGLGRRSPPRGPSWLTSWVNPQWSIFPCPASPW